MAKNNNKSEYSSGTIVYENWKAALKGAPSLGAYEYPLYTDARIISEIVDKSGPYQLYNAIHQQSSFVFAPSIVLRIENHIQKRNHNYRMDKTDVTRYHGGWHSDEVASLISLCLGIRLKSGGFSRSRGSDP